MYALIALQPSSNGMRPLDWLMLALIIIVIMILIFMIIRSATIKHDRDRCPICKAMQEGNGIPVEIINMVTVTNDRQVVEDITIKSTMKPGYQPFESQYEKATLRVGTTKSESKDL